MKNPDEEVAMATMLRVTVDVAMNGNSSEDGGDHLLDAMADIAMRACKREKLAFRRARLVNLGEHVFPPIDEEVGY